MSSERVSSISRKVATKKKAAKKASKASRAAGSSPKRSVLKRELSDTGNDRRYVRRNEKGKFIEVEEVSRSLSHGVKRRTKTKVSAGAKTKVPTDQTDNFVDLANKHMERAWEKIYARRG